MNKPVASIRKEKTTVEDHSSLAVSADERSSVVFGESTRAVSAELGYEIIGPLCYGYATWLAEQTRREGIEHIYFLSRDGWLLKKAFDLLPAETRAGLASHYLYSSRRAVWFASLDENTAENEFNEILSGASPYLPVGYFLKRIFLEPADCLAEIRRAGFDDQHAVVANATDRHKLYKLFKIMRPRIEAQAAREREDYLAYLKSVGFFEQEKVALADVGWTGSVIKYTRGLARRVNKDMDVHAYFIGVGRMAEKKYGFAPGTSLHGYLFEFDDNHHRQILKSFYVIEKFLSPNEPSLVKITRNQKGFEPVYKQGAREKTPLNFIVQNSALRFVRDHAKPYDQPDKTQFVPLLEKLLTRPDKETASLLGQYSYSSDFGYQTSAKPIAYSRLTADYLRSPLLLLKDYRRSRWKAGFIAQQPLPARLLLKTIRKTHLDRGFECLLLWIRTLR